MAANLETLRVIQALHDTVYTVVRDTVVRLAEPGGRDGGLIEKVAPSLLAFLGGVGTMSLKQWWDDRRSDQRQRQDITVCVTTICKQVAGMRRTLEGGASLLPQQWSRLDSRVSEFGKIIASLGVLRDRFYASNVYDWWLLAEAASTDLAVVASTELSAQPGHPVAVCNDDGSLSPLPQTRGENATWNLDELESQGAKFAVAVNVFSDGKRLRHRLVTGQYWPNAKPHRPEDFFTAPPIDPATGRPRAPEDRAGNPQPEE